MEVYTSNSCKTLIGVHEMHGEREYLQLFCWPMTAFHHLSYPMIMITHTALIAVNLPTV